MRIWLMGVIILVVSVGVSRADEVSDLKSKNADLASENVALKAQIDALSRRLATMQGERSALDAKFAAVSRRLAGIETGLQGMQTTLSKQLQETLDRLAMLESGGVRPGTMAKADNTNPRTNPRTNTNSNTGTNTTNNTTNNTNSKPPPRPYVRPNTTPTKSTNTDTKSNTNNGSNTTIARVDPPRPVIPAPTIKPRIRVNRPKGVHGLPTTIAVVDMVKVFDNLREKIHVEESLADLVYAVKFEDKKWAEKVRAYELDLQLLEKGSLPYLTKQHEIDKAKINWKVDLASAQAALNRKRGERMKELYNKMAEVCGRVADEQGFDMILFKEPDPNYENFRSVGDLAGSRMVLRANESVDLTEQVIRLLNREFLTRVKG